MLATTWRSSMPGARPTSLLGRSTRSGGHATPGRGTDPRSWRCSRSPKPPHESSRDNNLDSYRNRIEYEYEYEYEYEPDLVLVLVLVYSSSIRPPPPPKRETPRDLRGVSFGQLSSTSAAVAALAPTLRRV